MGEAMAETDREPPDLSHLHPLFRSRVVALQSSLAAESIPLAVFEAGRSPFRQAELYASGRAPDMPGATKTRAKAWQSFHMYGLAVDMVFRGPNGWTWTEPKPGMWKRYRELAALRGLRSLSFEQPHVELPVSLGDLLAGRYPLGGDETWATWLAAQIRAWGFTARTVHGIEHPPAPPVPSGAPISPSVA